MASAIVVVPVDGSVGASVAGLSAGGSVGPPPGPSPPDTLHSCVAGVASTLPARSIARTANSWPPGPAVTVCGEVQAAKAPPSSRHWNVEPVSVEWNAKAGGPAVMTVSGAV